MAPREQSPKMLEGTIEGLFPRHDPSTWPRFIGPLVTGAADERRVATEELAGIAKTLRIERAPGQNGIPNLALKVTIAEAPGHCRPDMQKYLDEGVFPEVWKRQFVSIAKGGETTRHMLDRQGGEGARKNHPQPNVEAYRGCQ